MLSFIFTLAHLLIIKTIIIIIIIINICIARVPYGNAHPRITIIQIKITYKFLII